MSGWTVHRLSELCDLRAGSAFKVHMQGRRQGDLPFIKVSDMNNVENEIGIRSANNWISMEDLATLKAKPLPPGTTVFAKIGEALRQNRVRLLSRPTIVDNNMMGAVPRLNAVDARFLYYRLSAFDLASTANGTALPYITVFVLGNVTFAIPPLPTQRRIADILSAYDDLIELNQRRIAILEEMVTCPVSSDQF